MPLWKEISPEFSEIQDFLDAFDRSSFRCDKRIERYVSFFGLDGCLVQLGVDGTWKADSEPEPANPVVERQPFEPDLGDLARLHWIVLNRKVLTALELGSGHSTAVMANAMSILSPHFGNWAAENLRVAQPFHVYAVEEEQWFADITTRRLKPNLTEFATVSRSSVQMILHDNRIATLYTKLPNVSPDFIYVDGPSQFATSEELNGFAFGDQCRMPMSADVLRTEFFLEPGTLILIDGRTANARFLKSYLRRNWRYDHDTIGDVHYFDLKEEPLGRLNRLKMEFCLNGCDAKGDFHTS